MRVIGKTAALVVWCLLGLAEQASAQSKADPKVQTATLLQTVTPKTGFVDNPFTFDRAGSRLLYVNSDTGSTASLVVLDVQQVTELLRVDLSAFTLKPAKVDFALDGNHFLVWSPQSDGQVKVALIAQDGKVVRTFGPAQDIVQSNYQGHEAIVVHRLSEVKRKGKMLQRHTVAVFDVGTGKSIGKKTNLDLDAASRSKALDFEFKYWANDFTVAIGIKGGEWDRKENQRSTDTEGWYEMPIRTFSKRLPITNLIAHRKRMARFVKYGKHGQDVVIKHNLSGIDYTIQGNFTPIKLAEDYYHYDPSSLVVQSSKSGSIFFTITIDPVHPDAAAKRRAVKPWVDLYEYSPTKKKATRRARYLAPKGRGHSWRASASNWVIVPRHLGFDRGGTKLRIYRLD